MLSEARLPRVHGVLDGERNWFRYAGTVLLVALVYFLSALAGNSLKFTGNVDAIWPPAGVAIAAVYILGVRVWPGILIGDLLADYPHHLPAIASIGQTAGNMLAPETLRRAPPKLRTTSATSSQHNAERRWNSASMATLLKNSSG